MISKTTSIALIPPEAVEKNRMIQCINVDSLVVPPYLVGIRMAFLFSFE